MSVKILTLGLIVLISSTASSAINPEDFNSHESLHRALDNVTESENDNIPLNFKPELYTSNVEPDFDNAALHDDKELHDFVFGDEADFYSEIPRKMKPLVEDLINKLKTAGLPADDALGALLAIAKYTHSQGDLVDDEDPEKDGFKTKPKDADKTLNEMVSPIEKIKKLWKGFRAKVKAIKEKVSEEVTKIKKAIKGFKESSFYGKPLLGIIGDLVSLGLRLGWNKLTPPEHAWVPTPTSKDLEYKFIQKGVPEIDDECKPKNKHFYRTIDGSCNWVNKSQTKAGSKYQEFSRDRPTYYADGIDQPRQPKAGTRKPDPRALSNAFFQQQPELKEWDHTPYLAAFVEFLIHDIIGSPATKVPSEIYDLKIPEDDPFFKEDKDRLTFWRTAAAPGTGKGTDKPRQNPNQKSVWFDLSQVYGDDPKVVDALRSHEDGKLKTGKDGGLPTTKDIPNVHVIVEKGQTGFVAGDPRVNQDILLQTMHTLFMKEHNRYCDLLKQKYPEGLGVKGHREPWTDENLFQTARVMMGAVEQMMGSSYYTAYFTESMPPPLDAFTFFRQWYSTFSDDFWFPIKEYPWKFFMNNRSDAQVPYTNSVSFSVGYRWHDLLPGIINLTDSRPPVDIQKSAFSTQVFNEIGFDDLTKGMSKTQLPDFHNGVANQLRNVRRNFRDPNVGEGFDLAAWAIEHERERGMPSFNNYYGVDEQGNKRYSGDVPILPRKTFEEFTKNETMVKLLKEFYATPDDVDLTVAQEIDSTNWPHAHIPTSMLPISLYTLEKGSFNDRLGINWALAECFKNGKPWDCTPSTVLATLFWKPIADKNPKYRFLDFYWLQEFDLVNQGHTLLWRMVTRHSKNKCLPKNLFFIENAKTNPVTCFDVMYFPGPRLIPSIFKFLNPNSLSPYLNYASKYGSPMSYKLVGNRFVLLSDQKFLKQLFTSGNFEGRTPIEFLSYLNAQVAGLGDDDALPGLIGGAATKSYWNMRNVVNKAIVPNFDKALPKMNEIFRNLIEDFRGNTGKKFAPIQLIRKYFAQLACYVTFDEVDTACTGVVDWFLPNLQNFMVPRKFWKKKPFNELKALLKGDNNLPTYYKDQIAKLKASGKTDSWLGGFVNSDQNLTYDQIVQASWNMVIGQAGAVGFALEYILYLLGTNPAAQNELLAEILEVVGKDGDVTIDHLKKMPVLLKTVKEGYRMHSPGGGLSGRYATEETVLDDRLVNKSDTILNVDLLVNSNKKYWGEDAGQFKPSRWQYDELDKFMADNRNFHYAVFGGGDRFCPGRNYAFFVSATYLVHTVREFGIKYPGNGPPKLLFSGGYAYSDPEIQVELKEHSGEDSRNFFEKIGDFFGNLFRDEL